MVRFNQITIFGGTGFLGRHIVRRLAKTGALLRIVTRNPEHVLPLKPMGDVGQIVPVLGSCRDDGSTMSAIGSSDVVINLIGILFENSKNTFQTIHVECAARLARIAREQGVSRVIHVSALGASPGSLSAYARSKAAGEQAVRVFFPEATMLRPSIVFGPEDNFFNFFNNIAKISPFLPLIGGGMTRFQPVYVGDVAEAVMSVLRRKDSRGQNYELGGPTVYSLRELLMLMLHERSLKRCLINLPWSLATFQAALLELLPTPVLTRDQIKLLKSDNIIKNSNAKTFRDLGITATSLEVILPTYIN